MHESRETPRTALVLPEVRGTPTMEVELGLLNSIDMTVSFTAYLLSVLMFIAQSLQKKSLLERPSL